MYTPQEFHSLHYNEWQVMWYSVVGIINYKYVYIDILFGRTETNFLFNKVKKKKIIGHYNLIVQNSKPVCTKQTLQKYKHFGDQQLVSKELPFFFPIPLLSYYCTLYLHTVSKPLLFLVYKYDHY